MRYVNYALLLLVILLSGCRKMSVCKDFELAFSRTAQVTPAIRTDGFYIGAPITDFAGVTRYNTLLFYRNGIMFLAGASEQPVADYVTSVSESTSIKDKSKWGVFAINGTTIQIAYWKPAQCQYPAILKSGYITSDTSFVLTQMELKDGKGTNTQTIDETYYFIRHNVKPDSSYSAIE